MFGRVRQPEAHAGSMHPGTKVRRLAFVVMVAASVLASATAPAAQAAERVEQAGNVPFYARFLAGPEWTAIIFYRPPTCVREDFNLLAFFDPEAFNCGPPTTDGFAVLGNTPNPFGAPLQLKLWGLGAVPIWFVRTAELNVAAEDEYLSVDELAALPSLVEGTATDYSEVLHPLEGAKVEKITVVARGTLEDGRSFRLQVTSVNKNFTFQLTFNN
jgi:hypothetical protein